MPDSAPKSFSLDQLHQTGAYWATHQDLFRGGRHWKEIPAVRERINRKMTGDPKIDLFGFVVHKYFLSKVKKDDNFLGISPCRLRIWQASGVLTG